MADVAEAAGKDLSFGDREATAMGSPLSGQTLDEGVEEVPRGVDSETARVYDVAENAVDRANDHVLKLIE
jgi:hypothetical protein